MSAEAKSADLKKDGKKAPNKKEAPTPKKRAASEISDDEDGDDFVKRAGRRKINIEFIEDKSRRHITFSKRKAGIMKKAYELSTLTGTQVLLLVASETGHVYTFATPKLQPLITKPEGKNLIQACLNAPDNVPAASSGGQASGSQRMSQPVPKGFSGMPEMGGFGNQNYPQNVQMPQGGPPRYPGNFPPQYGNQGQNYPQDGYPGHYPPMFNNPNQQQNNQ
eukprot:Nk52_evm2s2208 gene=Nk52_evmTU2s2208